jgi:quinol monooxygenase YgiN
MAVSTIATVKVKPGKEQEFERIFTGFAKDVRTKEPGTRVYELCKAADQPSTYMVIEIYDNAAAREAHGKSDHAAAIGPDLGPLLDGAPEMVNFDIVS